MRKALENYGIVLVLIGLCVLFSVLTLNEQTASGDAAVQEIQKTILEDYNEDATILVVGAANTESEDFARSLLESLSESGYTNTITITGKPLDLRKALETHHQNERPLEAIATTRSLLKWRIIDQIKERYPNFSDAKILVPDSYVWPDFLKKSNLLAIVDRIVVIAIIAIGMTMVIMTGGIDLSVGSLIALSAVIGTSVMKGMGGLEAGADAVWLGFLVGILACGLIGGFGGWIVHRFKVAPFITTLGIMMMARGLAFLITGGFSIYQVPKSLTWLGQGRLLGVPNTVILLIVLYAMAHIFMSYTRMGRYIYAVGGNEEASRLSGVPIGFVIPFVYVISGLAAGLGGAIQASQINTGAPNMGVMYELYVIAAVVVGGTSLSGGTGRILGTLIGAFIISVLQNGMNLLGIESYTQQVVLGGVILVAVLLDKLRSSDSSRKAIARNPQFAKIAIASAGAAILLLAVIFTPAFGKSESRGKIGMTCMDLTNPFFKLIANVMSEEAAKYGYEVVALSGEMDAAKQNNQLADFAAQGYDAIFLNPANSRAAGEGVKKAAEAGIPVFTFDIQVTDEEANALLISHIGSDNYQGGLLAAKSMMEATGDRGEIAILSYPEVTSCIYRANGFKDYLKENDSKLKIVTELSGKGNRNDGYAVATDLLQAHPNIVGIFAINDPSALGAHAAVTKAGKLDQITIVGFDASPAGKQAVFEKKLYDSPQQFPAKMALGTVEAFIKYLEGEEIPKDIFIPCSHYYYETSVNDESRVAEQW